MSRAAVRRERPGSPPEVAIEAGGRRIPVRHPGRILWPATGTTKGDLLAYLLAVAPSLLVHLARRPVMQWRFPEGVDGAGWFQAQCRGRPSWVEVERMIGRRGEALDYCLIEEPATLAWLASIGTIEFHPFLRTAEAPSTPTALVIDLDPGPPAGIDACARVALLVRERLEAAGLAPVVKTSGGAGIHVVAGVDGATFAATKGFARRIAEGLATDAPELVIARSPRAARAGLVFVDWIQNDVNRQTIAPYSPRATPLPGVSAPLRWDEVEAIAAGRPLAGGPRFSWREVLDRLERDGDAFEAAVRVRRPLPALEAGP